MGREAFRRSLTQRLLPTLRAFNPDLILLSCGFDGCKGDVGNSRTFPEEWLGEVSGMDLEPEDFAWATTEISKIADMCCDGRVISVLEGGYGFFHPPKAKAATQQQQQHPSEQKRKGASVVAAAAAADISSDVDNSFISPQQHKNITPSTDSSGFRSVGGTAALTPPGFVSAHLEKLVACSPMDRQSLTQCVAAHVHRLVDPYGDGRLRNRSAEQVREASLVAPRPQPAERDDKALSGEEDFEDEGDDGGCETDEDPPVRIQDMKTTP